MDDKVRKYEWNNGGYYENNDMQDALKYFGCCTPQMWMMTSQLNKKMCTGILYVEDIKCPKGNILDDGGVWKTVKDSEVVAITVKICSSNGL